MSGQDREPTANTHARWHGGMGTKGPKAQFRINLLSHHNRTTASLH